MVNQFGQNIKKIRTEKKLTQKEFAESIEVTAATISSYEKGDKTPNMDIAVKISDKYNVSLDWLCRGIAKKEPKLKINAPADLIIALNEVSKYGYIYLKDSTYPEITIAIYSKEIVQIFNNFKKVDELFEAGAIEESMRDAWIDGILKNNEDLNIIISNGTQNTPKVVSFSSSPSDFDEILDDDDLPF